MKVIVALIGLAAVAIALERRIDPPQPTVLVDVPDPSGKPIDDLDLKGSNNV